MTRRTRRWLLVGAMLLLAVVVLFQGELRVLIANQRPGAEAARLVEALRIGDGDTIAEIGAGKGALTVAVAKALPGSRVYSTELDQVRLAQIRGAVQEAAVGNVEVRPAAVADTNLPDACCDAVFMRTVYHHITSPDTFLAAVHRDLKPGGRLAVIEFEPRGLWTWFAVPHDTPDRGGHGVPKRMLVDEVTRRGLFRHTATVDAWVGPLYLMVFTKSQAQPADVTTAHVPLPRELPQGFRVPA